MRKRSSKKQTESEVKQPEPLPEPAIQKETPPVEKNPAAVALGKLGGKKGGPARAAKLTKEQRSEIAKKAAQTRWANRRNQGTV
jgi:hypothetical protein